jgi:hypothetical protein
VKYGSQQIRRPLVALSAMAFWSGFAMAEADLGGVWRYLWQENRSALGAGPGYGEYVGIPLNQEGRERALSWNAEVQTLREHQCIPLGASLGSRYDDRRIWQEVDLETGRVVAWRMHMRYMERYRTIWMDGRPHPPAGAAHTFDGYSTGNWQGDILVVTTTHLKEALFRNGPPLSDRHTIIEHFIRHGDYLTTTKMVEDPVYLSEPLVVTSNFLFNAASNRLKPDSCLAAFEVPAPQGHVPHYLPGKNPHADTDRARRGISAETWLGGAKTMYPDLIE